MSLASAALPSDPGSSNDWASEGKGGLVKQLCKASQFIQSIRMQLRFGDLTRAPIRLMRLQVIDDVVECDWMARSLDPWDIDRARNVQQRPASLQALRDAIDVRALLFDTMTQAETAHFRVYRESLDHTREMIIVGCAQRNDHSSRGVHSLVMRAKVLGFRFDLDGATFRNLSPKGPGPLQNADLS